MTAALLPPPPQDMSLLLGERPELLRRQSSCSMNSSRSHRSTGSRSAASIRFSARSAASGAGSICPQCASMGIRICGHCTTRKHSTSGRASLSRPGERFGSKSEVPENSAEATELLRCLRQSEVDLDEIAEILTESKSACNAIEPAFGWTPILFAAHIGDIKLMTVLLEATANPNATCSQGNGALHLAARRGHLDTAALLLSRGLDIEAKNAQGWTPLVWSAIAGCSSVAHALLDAAAEPGAADSAGRTACMWAARHGHADILRTLLPLGTDLSLCDEDGLTVKDHASYYAKMQSTLGFPSMASSTNGDGLDYATAEGSVDLQRLLMQHAAGAIAADSQCDDEGPMASVRAVEKAVQKSQQLLAAARKNDWEAAEEAMRGGACVATRGELDLASPLMWAAVHEAPAVAMSLVAAMADLEARDALGWTALHHAVHSGSAQMVAVLHYLGADFSAKTEEGDSVQHLAVLSDAGVMLQVLSPATTDWNIADASGHTPIQVAVARGCMSALTTLLALKVDANAKDANEQTLFSLGTVQGHRDVVRALVSPVDPPQHKWEEDDLNKMLDKLPWVDSDVVDDDHGHKSQKCHSSASSVCSGSTLSSSASVRNNKLGRGKQLARMPSMPGLHAIREVDSEAGSTFSRPRDGEEKRPSLSKESRQRPDSANSRASQARQRPRSADSSASQGSMRSHATQKSVAKSIRSAKSGAASVQSAARSVQSHVSAAKSTHSLASLHSKVGSKVSVVPSRASRMSRASGQSRRTWVSGSRSNRVSSMSPTIYTAAVTVIDRSPVSLMSAASKRCISTQLPAAMALSAVLSAEDKDGCKPLALAAQARHAHLVSLLLEWKAAPNSPDLRGNTALILAAAVGAKESVMLLLEANASADSQNAEGQQAVDVATNAEIRQILQEHMDRTVVAKKMTKSCSLPAIVKPPAKKPVSKAAEAKPPTFRLRLDGLPLRVQAEEIEKDLFDILRRNRVPRPVQMEVVVDPITMLSRGHGFMVYASREQCEAAEECVVDEFEEDLLTSIDEVKA